MNREEAVWVQKRLRAAHPMLRTVLATGSTVQWLVIILPPEGAETDALIVKNPQEAYALIHIDQTLASAEAQWPGFLDRLQTRLSSRGVSLDAPR